MRLGVMGGRRLLSNEKTITFTTKGGSVFTIPDPEWNMPRININKETLELLNKVAEKLGIETERRNGAIQGEGEGRVSP